MKIERKWSLVVAILLTLILLINIFRGNLNYPFPATSSTISFWIGKLISSFVLPIIFYIYTFKKRKGETTLK